MKTLFKFFMFFKGSKLPKKEQFSRFNSFSSVNGVKNSKLPFNFSFLFIFNICIFSLFGIWFKNSRLTNLLPEQLRWVIFLHLLKFKLVNWLKEQSNFSKLTKSDKSNSPSKFRLLIFKKITFFLFFISSVASWGYFSLSHF